MEKKEKKGNKVKDGEQLVVELDVQGGAQVAI